MSILNIFENIGSDTKRSHKLALIEQHKDNALFLKVVKMALDPYVNFYIRKIPDYTFRFLEGDNDAHKTLDWALVELEKLSERAVTGHAGIEHLRNILSSLDRDDAVVIERIIGKDLRCGMADGTVNAVIKNYIPEYPCLLARPYDDKNIKNITYPAISQKKGDGLRLNAHVINGAVMLCGRSGREIDILGKMDKHFSALGQAYGRDCVFDGEMVVVDNNGKILPRKISNGILNKAIKGTISEKEANLVRVMLWDVIPINEFKAGISTETYDIRFNNISSVVNSNKVDSSLSWIIETKEVNSLTEAIDHFNEMLSQGEEGTLLKNKCGLWEDTRSKHLVKFKSEKECDLAIIGYHAGEGKFTGMVGSLICESSDSKVNASISGFSDKLRKEITDNIDLLIGKIVEITYNERISSDQANRVGVDSLFLPRFSRFREDKSIANSSSEIK